MLSKDKNKIKTTKAFLSVDNTRHKKVLQKKTKPICMVAAQPPHPLPLPLPLPQF